MKRILSASLAAVLVLLAATPARADDHDAGVVLTTTGASLVVSAPITALIGLAISSANPTDGGIMGPFAIGAFASGCVGLGVLIPGIVMLATSKRAPADEHTQPTARKEPTFVLGADLHSGVLPTPRAVVFPILRASF